MSMPEVCPLCDGLMEYVDSSLYWRNCRCTLCGLLVRISVGLTCVPPLTSMSAFNVAHDHVFDALINNERTEPCPD